MKKLMWSLVTIIGLITPQYSLAHETHHKFSLGIVFGGQKVEVYKFEGPQRLSDALSDSLLNTIKGWKNDPNSKELTLQGTSGKITIFEKSQVSGTFADDLTPQEPEHKIETKQWRRVAYQHCNSGWCNRVTYTWVYQ